MVIIFVLGMALTLGMLPWLLFSFGLPANAFTVIGWLAALLAFIVWALVSIWRSARQNRAWIRYPVQLLTVLVVIILVLFTLAPHMHDYTARVKVQEAVNIASPARIALGIACSEEDLRPGMTHEELGLLPAGDYQSHYQHSVTATVLSSGTVTVTVLMKEIKDSSGSWLNPKPGVKPGEVIVYTGACAQNFMTWTISGTVDDYYLPKN